MTDLPSKQPDDQRSEAECQLEYQKAGLEAEVLVGRGGADREQQGDDERRAASHGSTARVAARASAATSSAGRFQAAGFGAS